MFDFGLIPPMKSLDPSGNGSKQPKESDPLELVQEERSHRMLDIGGIKINSEFGL